MSVIPESWKEYPCAVCGEPFRTSDHLRRIGRGKACSVVCGKELTRRARVERGREQIAANSVDVACAQCGKGFSITPSRLRQGRGKFCSQACSRGNQRKPEATTSVPRVTRTCICGKKFRVRLLLTQQGKGKFCSPQCSYKSRLSVKVAEPHKFGKTQRTPTSITPKAADRIPAMGDLGSSGLVNCARCRQPRGRGLPCRTCEWRLFESEVAS